METPHNRKADHGRWVWMRHAQSHHNPLLCASRHRMLCIHWWALETRYIRQPIPWPYCVAFDWPRTLAIASKYRHFARLFQPYYGLSFTFTIFTMGVEVLHTSFARSVDEQIKCWFIVHIYIAVKCCGAFARPHIHVTHQNHFIYTTQRVDSYTKKKK